MADEKPASPKRRPRKAAPAAVAAATKDVPLKLPPDTRRILPTQDWVTKVDRANLDAVAATQILSASHFYAGLLRLRQDFATQVLLPPLQHQLPREISGTVILPDGTPGTRLAVSVLPFVDANNAVVQVTSTTITDPQGLFTLRNLPMASVKDAATVTLQFRGSNGSEARAIAVAPLGALGILGNVQLKLGLGPLPLSIVASLLNIVDALDATPPDPPRPGTTENPITLKMGDEDCPITFSHDLPEERYRYSILVRLVEPRTSILTETFLLRREGAQAFQVASWNKFWGNIPGVQHSFAERVPVDQPISVDGFRDNIVGFSGGVITAAETVPMAGTLGLGYIVQLAQQWRSAGLSLGDLVYSLPLAPGEQQRVAVFEQRQTLSTAELETLDFDEQQHQDQTSDASTQAVFNSSFAESVRGSSSFQTSAESSSWGVAGGIGGFIAPIAFGIGAGGGGGSSSSSGSSSNSLDGTRNYVSNAASQAHSSVERNASARRHAQRTGMRLATASDVEQVTTKIITNNNRIHALTMQYWEVLRHFEISTAVDGVTLVCFVPLEVVRFLPPGVSFDLTEAEVATRQQILYRYGPLHKHADILKRWIPFDFRQGLTILEEFASNPRAQPSFTSATEDIVNLSIKGSFLPFEDIYVQVLTRRGSRLGPVRMSGSIPPLPDTITDPTHAFKTKTELVAELLRRRAPDQDITLTANITLPSSINPDDVVGFELSRGFRTLTYTLAPPATDPLQQLIAGGNIGGIAPFFPVFADRIDAQLNGVTMTPDQLESELGGPSIWGFSAAIPGPPPETYASSFIGRDSRFPMPADGYPVAAQAVNPLLKFNQLLRIEQTLQHCVRNTITYSRAVWMSLTPEERAIMLEGFTIGVPAGGLADPTQHVPLLNCVANQVLGFYGNAMIMPFNIPAEIATQLTVGDQGQAQRPFTTAEIQNALTHFHRTGFSPPVSHVVLPTRGVLGEAVLGQCASAEKIDLTRFWNWQDSPIPQAADIAGGLLNKGSSLIAATAPSTLVGMPSQITNINAPPADANAALQQLIAGQNTKDLPDITGLTQLATLQGKTLDTAEKARADALARAQTLASDGLKAAGDIMKAKSDSSKAAAADKKSADADAQKAKTTQLQTGVTNMRANAANYLAVANAKGSQGDANDYANQIISQVFGGNDVPIDTASSLFTSFQKFVSGNTGPLTQGSTAFLTALGLLA
ncbi:MAG TPA: carboxypeptidase-like regulatory domain-containing protein [Candidatus Binatia bacterium]|nr:carboxypeptidase-like regulatory domain-containing protein [Candidatus Binatia bacterium]